MSEVKNITNHSNDNSDDSNRNEANITNESETSANIIQSTDNAQNDTTIVPPASTDANNEVGSETTEVDVTSDKIDVSAIVHKFDIIKALRILFTIGFVLFAALFLNEILIQPYLINKGLQKVADLKPISVTITPTPSPIFTATPVPTKQAEPDGANSTADNQVTPKGQDTVIKASDRDEQGRLLKFRDLIEINNDVKGWITIPDSNMDLVVMQPTSGEGPEYYLTHDLFKKKFKAGCLFLDYKSSVEENTQNIVIHGHNMTSTDNMFHYLLRFKELSYYKKRPVFTFDSIYNTGKWKIFAVFVTNGSSTKEPLFNYTRSTFQDSSDFLNFVYQLRIRSIYHMDTVDVNENDQIITLSTCSYEVKNYRTVIVARKVRDGEDPAVDVDSVTINKEPLYPGTWYYRFGGKPPKLAATFEEALANGDIQWYKPVEVKK